MNNGHLSSHLTAYGYHGTMQGNFTQGLQAYAMNEFHRGCPKFTVIPKCPAYVFG